MKLHLCDICHRSYSTARSLASHKYQVHGRGKTSKTVTLPITVGLHQPTQILSNQDIVQNYLKNKSDEDKGALLRSKILGFSPTVMNDVKSTIKPENNPNVHDQTKVYFQCPHCEDQFTEQRELEKHLPVEHSACPKCNQVFSNFNEYSSHWREFHKIKHITLMHHATERVKDIQHALTDDDISPNITSDSSDTNESSDDELKNQDSLSRKHLNCVTVDRFLQVRNLIARNEFESLIADKKLINAMRTIIVGVTHGFIPLCSSQRLILTPRLKQLLHKLNRSPSSKLILENRDNITQLFQILGNSIRFIVDSFHTYGI